MPGKTSRRALQPLTSGQRISRFRSLLERTSQNETRYPAQRKPGRTRPNSDEAGATPHFDALCVTASVGSLPPQSRAARDSLAASQSRSFGVVRQRPLHAVREKARTRIKAPQYNPRRRPSQVHDEQGIKGVLDRHAYFSDDVNATWSASCRLARANAGVGAG